MQLKITCSQAKYDLKFFSCVSHLGWDLCFLNISNFSYITISYILQPEVHAAHISNMVLFWPDFSLEVLNPQFLIHHVGFLLLVVIIIVTKLYNLLNIIM